MLIRKAFKFRLKTNDNVNKQLSQFAGCCRFVWNKAWALNLERLRNRKGILRYHELDFWTKLWKDSEEYGFLRLCHSQILQQKLKDLDKAYKDAFDKTQPNKRLPKSKKKGVGDSFRFPQGFKLAGNQVYLPKIGWVRFFQSRKIVGTPKNVTVSRRGEFWYISVQTEIEIAQPQHPSSSLVGIDLGITRFATLSNGDFLEPKNSFRAHEKKLKKAQQILSKKVKFSKNWSKQKRKIQTLHHRISNIRSNYLHIASHQISKNHAIIVMEDLKVSNMSRSAKGDTVNPGRNVAAKSGLNKSILDQGWYTFGQQLSYKQYWRGGEVLRVNPKNTSITCLECSCCIKENRKTQSVFECIRCGYRNHADLVGAINVARAGYARLACGVAPWGATVKQESSRVAA